MTVRDLVDRLLDGEVNALARAISLVENGSSRVADILRRVYPNTGNAYVVGITGPPGAGKSSLVNVLTTALRQRGERVGIIAVDPSSAFSGGAILGDRIRMQTHAADTGVFIRSMANRGHAGGLSKATHDAVDLMDAAGYSTILLETVGVGQDEIEVVEGADTVCVVLVPGMGDDVQSIKAGIMEIAHVFVINKADRDGVDRVQTEIEQMLSLADWSSRWRPRIARTVATRAEGVDELLVRIDEHHKATSAGTGLPPRRQELSRTRFIGLAQERLLELLQRRAGTEAIDAAIDDIATRRLDPYTATARVIEQAGFGENG